MWHEPFFDKDKKLIFRSVCSHDLCKSVPSPIACWHFEKTWGYRSKLCSHSVPPLSWNASEKQEYNSFLLTLNIVPRKQYTSGSYISNSLQKGYVVSSDSVASLITRTMLPLSRDVSPFVQGTRSPLSWWQQWKLPGTAESTAGPYILDNGQAELWKSFCKHSRKLFGVVIHGGYPWRRDRGPHWKSCDKFWPSALVLALSEDRNGESKHDRRAMAISW